MLRLWNNYWFVAGGSANLAILRLCVCFSLLIGWWYYALPDYSLFLEIVNRELFQPVLLVRLLGPGLPDPSVLEFLKWLGLVSLFSGLVGFWSRTSLWLAFFSNGIVIGFAYCFSYGWSHHYVLPLLLLMVLGCSPCGDRFALDSRPERPSDGVPRYEWAVRLSQVLCALFFLNAAWFKLTNSGLEWIFSNNMRWVLAENWYLKFPAPTPFARWLMNTPWAYQGAALANTVFQILPILAVFSVNKPRLRLFFGLFFVLEALGLLAALGFWFIALYPLAAVFVDWEYFFPRLRVQESSSA